MPDNSLLLVEAVQARAERTQRRLTAALLISIALLAATLTAHLRRLFRGH